MPIVKKSAPRIGSIAYINVLNSTIYGSVPYMDCDNLLLEKVI